MGLRDELDRAFTSLPDWRGHIEQLRSKYGHSIQHQISTKAEREYTCIPYALGLIHDSVWKNYVNIAASTPRAGLDHIYYAGSYFLEWLCQNKLKRLNDPIPGCLVVYINNNCSGYKRYKHMGIYIGNDVVRSKFGMWGLIEHRLLEEVPEDYGDVVEYYSALSPQDSWDYFDEFHQEKQAYYS